MEYEHCIKLDIDTHVINVSVMKRKRKTRSATHEVCNCIFIIGIIAEIGDKWRDIVRR